MFKINIIKRTFVPQVTEDGCGLACLAMVLHYAGRPADATKLAEVEVPPGGFSLKQLKDLAYALGLSCQCVEMEIDFLRTLKKPLILHTVNGLGQDHFEVCYGYHKKLGGNCYILADPGLQVHYVNEKDLTAKWVSSAALYFHQLDFNAESEPALFHLLRQRSYPLALLATVPVLSLCIAFFGIALTWLLQKGLANSGIFNGHIIYALLLLLFIICLFKNLFAFLRQYIIVQINMNTNRMLVEQLVKKVETFSSKREPGISEEIKGSLINIQKMQNAISSFIAVVLSDGAMVLILIASSLYMMPMAGLINLLYILTLTYWEITTLPVLIYQSIKTRTLSGAAETALINQALQRDNKSISCQEDMAFHAFYNKNLNFAKNAAIGLSRRHLLLECLGTLNLMLVIAMAIFRFEALEIDYNTLMLIVIEAYLTTVLMQRICASLQNIAEGADAVLAHNRG